MPGPGQGRQKQAFAPEQDILEAWDQLDVELNCRVHDADMASMDEQPFSVGEVALDDFARQVKKDRAGAAHLLQDEALAAEKPGADALLPSNLQRHRFFRAQEGLLAADQRLAGR